MNLSFALILSLTTSVIAAKSKLSDSWEIDDSCDPPRLEKLEEAHSEIVELLTKVTNDLAHVQQPRPATRWGKPNWNRISRNLAGLFGLQPNDAIIENGYDPGEQYFSQVLYTYDRMYQALVNGKAVPENGYSGKLTDQSQHSKPLLLCGDTRTWERFEKDDPDKYDASKTVGEVFPEAAKTGGAFIRANRYLGAGPGETKPDICTGIYGMTLPRHDLITICDNTLELDDEKWPVRDGGAVVQGTDLDRDHFGRQSLVRVMLHEFAHYYGSRMEGSAIKVLTDQQAVDKNGCLLWSDGSARRVPEPTNANGEQLQIQHVYSLRYCTHISRDQTNNQHAGQFEKDGAWVAGTLGNSGPSAATWTAETYAYFPIISYLDKWEWLTTGKASPL
ncbi:uncharacterized protein FSUBG_2102 [Fusarium subglutinans]|uniref:Metalloprotease n=1 Tax=Gibberella subglutinans TaxID=42677 RepID=A0A8H5Q8J3_GIBSU|nr:uncharacterized protein FSUBG_2102 [Fusarium subglutinans]KAF5611665.1 hypothetical protein FSUBG_2102 [Fusarium subglutinans]